MAQTADHLVIIARGRIIADAPIQSILDGQGKVRSRVRTDQPQVLMNALAGEGVSLRQLDAELLEITGVEPRHIAAAALNHQVLVYELTPLQASLEEAYMQLTKDEVEYHSGSLSAAGTPGDPGVTGTSGASGAAAPSADAEAVTAGATAAASRKGL